MTSPAASRPLPAFVNEPVTDFSLPENQVAAQAALAQVRSQFGQEHELRIAGARHKTGDFLNSVNPSKPSEIVGRHHKASAELANHAIEDAHAYFPEWSRTPVARRVDLVVRAAALIRERKLEFDAWLVVEAGKTWPEADADVSEAIDFAEYYARQMQRLASPEALVQMPGERDEMVYLPLGAGVIIPPWNFPLAIMTGMSLAALVAGNTVVIKPSSETPTVAAKFAEVLLEAGLPASRRAELLWAAGAVVGDVLASIPRRASSPSPDRATSACASTNWRRSRARGRSGSSAWSPRWAARTHHRGSRSGSRQRRDRRGPVRLRLPGTESARPARAPLSTKPIYDEFLTKLKAKVARRSDQVGPSEESANYMGPVINAESAQVDSEYIEVGKKEGRSPVAEAFCRGATATSSSPP